MSVVQQGRFVLGVVTLLMAGSLAVSAIEEQKSGACSIDILNTLFNRDDPSTFSNAYLALLVSRYTYPTAFGITSTAEHTQEMYRELYRRKWTALGALHDSITFIDEEPQASGVLSLLTSQPEAHAVVFATNNDVWVSFRGLTNIEAGFGDSSRFNAVNGTFSTAGGSKTLPVHGGFYSSFVSIWLRVRNAINVAVQQTADPTRAKVYLTGHSMGAALAVFSAMRLLDENVPLGAIYVFGAPKMGQQPFIDEFMDNGLELITFHWWNELDMIPGMSPPIMRALPYVQLPIESLYRIWQGRCQKADGATAMQCPQAETGARCIYTLSDHFAFTYVMKMQDCLLDMPAIASVSCMDNLIKATM